jgi:hypothetical protein
MDLYDNALYYVELDSSGLSFEAQENPLDPKGPGLWKASRVCSKEFASAITDCMTLVQRLTPGENPIIGPSQSLRIRPRWNQTYADLHVNTRADPLQLTPDTFPGAVPASIQLDPPKQGQTCLFVVVHDGAKYYLNSADGKLSKTPNNAFRVRLHCVFGSIDGAHKRPDCQGNEICRGTECVGQCSHSEACPPGYECREGFCLVEALTCHTDRGCNVGLCKPIPGGGGVGFCVECIRDGDCPPGTRCSEELGGICLPSSFFPGPEPANLGLYVGIGVGVLVLVGVIALLVYLSKRKKSLKQAEKEYYVVY